MIIDVLYQQNDAKHWCTLVDATCLSISTQVWSNCENSMSHTSMITS